LNTQKVLQLLLKNRGGEDSDFWYWLKPNQLVSRKDANKFMLASILDYQMHAEIVWENARRLAEDIFDDPDDLWHKITEISLEAWMAKREEYSLHRFPKAHERVWTIGKRIVQQYEGDTRKIWEGQTIKATHYRLNDLGVGEQISRMVVGGLFDTGQIKGKSDVKVDIHVRRVLGRILHGREFSEQEIDRVIEITRGMNPNNPWLLDRPLYLLGKSLCVASTPKCSSCFLNVECAYHEGKKAR
jgi:endonuclease III